MVFAMIQLENQAALDAEILPKLNACWEQVLARGEIGFPALPAKDAEWKAIATRASQAKPATRVLVLGIGGSSLGTQVIAQALGTRRDAQVYFLESPDPHSLRKLGDLKSAEWKSRHLVIVSKSGNTLETLAWVEKLNAIEPGWLRNSEITVIASPGNGPLQTWAKSENLNCLWIPTDVGGRFSVLTAVGMLPAALLGLDIDGFRGGADWALKNPKLASQLSAGILASWRRGEWITQLWSYSEGLRVFGEWWQQLWGESLGKKLTRAGCEAPRASTPMACSGPRDQHSLVQQLMEGARDKYVLITRVKSEERDGVEFTPTLFPTMPFAGKPCSFGQVLSAEASAFEKSLDESKIHFQTLHVDTLDEKTLGALFMLWQMVIAQLGEYMQIDAFNQPGVESGKKHAFANLRELRG
jgi:glucose-6-phosphate isomerase